MRMVRRERSAMLVVVAALLIATTWIAVGERSDGPLQDP